MCAVLLPSFPRKKFLPEVSFFLTSPYTRRYFGISILKSLASPSFAIKGNEWFQYENLNYFTWGINIERPVGGVGKTFGGGWFTSRGRRGDADRRRPWRQRCACVLATQRRSLSFLIDPVTQYTWPHSAASLPPPPSPPRPSVATLRRPFHSSPPCDQREVALLPSPPAPCSFSLFSFGRNTADVASRRRYICMQFHPPPLLSLSPFFSTVSTMYRGLVRLIAKHERSPWVKLRPSSLFFFLFVFTFFFLI